MKDPIEQLMIGCLFTALGIIDIVCLKFFTSASNMFLFALLMTLVSSIPFVYIRIRLMSNIKWS